MSSNGFDSLQKVSLPPVKPESACLVSQKFRSSIQDLGVYRGADVGLDLLVAKFSLKLKSNEKKVPNSEPQFDSNRLLDRMT